MAFDEHKNLALTRVTGPPAPALSGLTVAVADHSVLPPPPYNATVWPAGQNPTDENAEIVRVTGDAAGVLTIVRAQEGSSAVAISVGYQLAATLTAKTILDLETVAGAALFVKNGQITDSDDPRIAPADGDFGLDTDTNRLVYRSNGEWFGLTPPAVPDFAIVATGSIAYALDKTGAIVGRSSSRDSGAVMQACLTALKSSAGNAIGTIQLGPQNHDWKSVPKIPMVPTGTTPDHRWLRILGYGAKVTFSIAGAARLVDMDKPADHDQLANTYIAGMVVDAGSVMSTYNSAHVLIGTEDVSHSTYRVNVDRLVMEDIDVFNVPYDPTSVAQRRGVDLLVRQAATGEGTMNWITNVFMRRVRFNPGKASDPLGLTGSGPNRGFLICGILNDGTSLPANVFIDNIVIDDCEVNTGHTPTAGEIAGDTCIQIGGNGFGGRCSIRRFKGSGSDDVTIEIDGMTYSLCEEVVSVDHANGAILYTNFANPQYPSASKHVARSCYGRIQNAVATGGTRSLFLIGSTDQYAALNEISIEGCSLYSAQTDAPQPGWLLKWIGACSLVTVDELRGVMDQLAATLTANGAGSALAIYPPGTAEFRPHKIKVKYAGAITKSGHTYQLRGMEFVPADVAGSDLTVRGTQPSFEFHSTVTGVAAGDTEAVRVGSSSTPTHVPTIRGWLPGVVGKLSGDDTDPYGIHVAASTAITIDHELNFRDGDFSGYPTGGTQPNLSGAAPFFGRTFASEDLTQARLVKAPGFKIAKVDYLLDTQGSAQGPKNPAGTSTITNTWPVHMMWVFTNAAAALLTDVQITRRPQGNTIDLGAFTGPFFLLAPGDDIKFTFGGPGTPALAYVIFPMPF